jgi:hypothetical protein
MVSFLLLPGQINNYIEHPLIMVDNYSSRGFKVISYMARGRDCTGDGEQ